MRRPLSSVRIIELVASWLISREGEEEFSRITNHNRMSMIRVGYRLGTSLMGSERRRIGYSIGSHHRACSRLKNGE